MIHGTAHPPVPPQTPVVTCGKCRRVLGTVTTALLDTHLGRVMAAAMERGLARCPDCGPLQQGEALP
jgi:hypothetical protein